MNYLKIFIIGACTILPLQILYCQNDFPQIKGSYFGQKAPTVVAEVFMDGIISTIDNPEMCAAFTKDGKEFYFNSYYKNSWTIFCTKEVNDKWINPKPMDFTANFIDRDFSMSPDGNRIYFGSNRPRKIGEDNLESLDIYMTERLANNQWSEPKNIGDIINTNFGENYPSIAQNGNLYFFSNRKDGFGGCDIYMARFVNGRYATPENLGSAINCEKNDWDAYIAPDESYIIFSSQNRDDSIGGQDLYISFKSKIGNWTQARNMGAKVNSFSSEICPSVSLDGKFLFFTCRRRGKPDIFWISTKFIDELFSG